MIRLLVQGMLREDPKIRVTAGSPPHAIGHLMASNPDGQQVPITLVAFGRLAQQLADYRKNDVIAVTGRAKLRAYGDKFHLPAPAVDLTIDGILNLRPAGFATPPLDERTRASRLFDCPGDPPDALN